MKFEYENPLGVTSQFSFCGLPFRLDTYSGCAFNCTYCFARLRGGKKSSSQLRIANPDKIINRFNSALNNDNFQGIISQYIRRRMPIHFGGMSDPFQPAEKTLQISLAVLKYLNKIQYPIVISTKSPLISSDKYIETLSSNKNIVVQFSFSTLEDERSAIVEPFSTKPSTLLKAIEKLSNNNIIATVRWQPYIPNFSEASENFIKTISGTGARHIGIEHLKLPVESNNPLWVRLVKNLNFDIKEYYKSKSSKRDGREFILPAKYKVETILEIKKNLRKYDITLGVADNDLQYLSDTLCCCSGIDQFEGFDNWNKFQIGYAIRKSLNEPIEISKILNEWKPTGAIDKYLNSESRINSKNNSHTVSDYIFERWQNLESSFNPTFFYNINFNKKYDNLGFKIYEWKANSSLNL